MQVSDESPAKHSNNAMAHDPGWLCCLVTSLLAGTFPAAAEENEFSVWGGFFLTNAPEIEGFSDGTSANLPIRNVTRSEPDQGWFGGISYETSVYSDQAMFRKIEWYFEGQNTERDSNALTSVGVGSIPFVTGLAAGIGPVPLTASAERERYEFGASLSEFDNAQTWRNLQITPFGGFGSEHAASTAVLPGFGLTINNSDLDWWYIGLMFGREHSINLSDGLDLVFEGNAGPYYHDASGDLTGVHNLGGSSASISGNGVGVRANAQIELRRMVTQSLDFSVFGGVDYWTNIPFTKLSDPSNFTTQPVGVRSGETLDLRVGVKVTLKLGQ